MSTGTQKRALVIFSAFGLMVAFIILNAHSRKRVEPQSQSVQATTPTEPAAEPDLYKVSPYELLEKYEANEVKADREFHGKTLVVTGRIASIDKDFTDAVVIKFETGQMFTPVMAELVRGQEDEAAALVKGQRVTVQCSRARFIVGYPNLDECLLNVR